MNRTAYNLIATALTTLALSAALPAHADSAGAAFDRVSQTYAASSEHKWTNALLPEASSDFVVAAKGPSADTAFMRQIAYYSRDMLDRGGWVNAYVEDSRDGLYASGNALLAVRVGDGVTSRVMV